MKRRGSLYNLLISILFILLVYPMVSGRDLFGKVFAIFFSWVLISGVFAVSGDNKKGVVIALILGIPTLAFIWLEQFLDSRIFDFGFMITLAVFVFYVVYALLSHIIRAKKVTGEILAGAASAYLLIGISWGMLYSLLEAIQPGSFSLPQGITDAGTIIDVGWSTFIYFSFTTLTTLGYGDIVPVTERAQSLVIIEASVGILFTALLVSRLVGMYLYQLRKDDNG